MDRFKKGEIALVLFKKHITVEQILRMNARDLDSLAEENGISFRDMHAFVIEIEQKNPDPPAEIEYDPCDDPDVFDRASMLLSPRICKTKVESPKCRACKGPTRPFEREGKRMLCCQHCGDAYEAPPPAKFDDGIRLHLDE
jgi:hypothetical protein